MMYSGGMKEKMCTACKQMFPASVVHFYAYKNGTLRAECRTCWALRDASYRRKNRDKITARHKRYRQQHAQELREYQRKHLREGDTQTKRREQARRRLALPVNRIKNNLRRRLHHAVACAVKHAPTFALIGCTPDQLKAHLEAAFLPGMTWENYGKGGWHIDHVVPCAAFDMTKESEQKKCFHYSNLKPLWGRDNMSKGKKVASRPECGCSAIPKEVDRG